MSTPHVPAAPTPARTPPPEGRPALQELAELLLLRQRPAAVAIAGVLGLGFLLAIAGVVPSGPVAGLVAGLLALVAALAAMLAADAADPVVRGPRHLRVTGRTVVGRVGDDPTALDVAPVVDGLVQGLEAVRRIRMVVVGLDEDAAALTGLVAEGVATAGRSVLLVDLTTGGDEPGITDVADGTHRLGDVAVVAPGLRLARVGLGGGGTDPLAAAAQLAATPPSDLDLLVTLLPEDGRPGSGLLAGTDRVLAVVPLGRLQRDDVSRRLSLIEGSRSTMATVVVVDPPGGVTTDDEDGMTPDDAPLVAPLGEAADAPTDDAAPELFTEPAEEPAEPVVEPADEQVDEPVVALDAGAAEERVAAEPASSEPATDDAAVDEEPEQEGAPEVAEAATPVDAPPVDVPAVDVPDEPAVADDDEPAVAEEASVAPDDVVLSAEDVAAVSAPADDRGPAPLGRLLGEEPSPEEPSTEEPEDAAPAADEAPASLPGEVDATAELEPIGDDVHLVDDDELGEPDELLATAALESLMDERED